MQYQSRRSAFFASAVQAISDMIYLLFLLSVVCGFWKKHYRTSTSTIIISHPIFTRAPTIVAIVSVDALCMVFSLTSVKDNASI